MIWQSLLGLVLLTATAWALGETRDKNPWKLIAGGLAFQFALALLFLKLPGMKTFFLWLNSAVNSIQEATKAGTSFVFGYVGGGPLPFQESYPGASFIFAFQALPLILVVSALSAVLFHWRVLPLVIRGFSWTLERAFRIGGATGFATAANIFVGMVEAPLFVRPYIAKLARSDLFVVMSAGMATIAGTVMVLYATILSETIPDSVGHLLAASMISAPAAIMVARLMVPRTDDDVPPVVAKGEKDTVEIKSDYSGTIDAVARGTMDGVNLLIYVIAMLLVMVALVSLVNSILSLLPDAGGAALTLQGILGWIMTPVAWLLGIPWDQAGTAGQLLGIKVVLNEFLAYLDLTKLPPEALDPRSRIIITYAICGFANFGSLGIMIGGLLSIAPERRGDILHLGPRSIVSGVLATSMTGAVVGVIV